MTARAGGHERIYRGLLRLYPANYRERYSEQMVQLFADQRRDTGAARAWLKTPVDLVTSAASEHLRRNRPVAHSLTLQPTPASRVSGLLGLIAGAMLLVGFLGTEALTPDLFNLRLVVFTLGAIAVVIAAHQRQARAGRRLALSGAIPAIVGNALYLVLVIRAVSAPGQIGPGDYQPVWLWIVGGAALWLGDAWFGLVTLRLGVLNRASAFALVVGSLLALAGMGNFLRGSPVETIILGGIAVHGLAWILLGLEIALRRRPAPPVAPA
ncbi:MAG: hypothetical protein QOJ81_1459 [Chloroflexota bacterium]|jgi:hypothetical protein|nr:hypothetical protein [Chloroflexota bacterium]